MESNLRVFAAELIGTAVLMVGGPGSAILAADRFGALGVSLAFGFSLLVMAYAIGHVSGCHINPAVTLGMLLTRHVDLRRAIFYWVAQFIGAFLGGLLLWIIIGADETRDQTGVFAANGWGDDIGSAFGLGPTVVVEIAFTALLVFVVLSTTTRGFLTGFDGIAIGLALALIHLVTIPVDNTSVNPARSFGAAVFGGSDAMGQLWAFIVFPLIGAVVGVLVWLLVHEARLESTMLHHDAVAGARDRAAGVAQKAEDKLT